MKRVFVDTNIVIDLLCVRRPWFRDAQRLYSLAENGEISLYCSALTLATASYIMGTYKISNHDIIESIEHLCQICIPTRVDAEVVQKAIHSNFTDFEDAMQYYSAKTVNADLIITRNIKDFAEAEIPVMTADAYLESL